MNETVASLTVTAKAEGFDQTKKQVDGLAQSTERLGVVTEQTSKRTLSMEDAWKRQTLRLDEVARAQNNIARETKIADAMLRETKINAEQHAERLNLINQRYAVAGEATQKFATQTGLARHELINLGRQAQDVAVQLGSGQGFGTVLLQQVPQIADVFIASGKSVGDFFKQAIGWGARFLTSTAGVVTGIAAIGAAASYAAVQFLRASTTIEQALENENRLLKEGKALIDQRTSAEARAQLNPKDLTEYELKRNLLDVQRKLNEEARGALIRSVPSRPGIGDIRGEFSAEVPPLTPGMDKLIDAAVKLKAAQAAGLPGLKEFNAELGRIATAHPELAKTVDKMIELGRTGIELENAEMRLKAISDALKGVATDAQLAAVGLGSVAQFQVSKMQAKERLASTEREAQKALELTKIYGTQSVEVAKTLAGLRDQANVAGAIGVQEEMRAQRRARINQLEREGMSLQDATKIANAEMAVTQARINAEHEKRMMRLTDELNIAQQITGLGRINAQYEAQINQLLLEGFNLTQATAQAEMQRSIALAQVNVQAELQLKNLQNEYELIVASSEEEKGRIKARQEYVKLIEEGVTAERAGAIASQMQANARATQDAANATKSWSVANDEAVAANRRFEASLGGVSEDFVNYAAAAREASRATTEFIEALPLTRMSMSLMNPYIEGKTSWGNSQFNPAGYTSQTSGAMQMTAIYRQIYGDGGFDPQTGVPNAQGFEFQFNKMLTQAGGNVGGAVNTLLSGGVLTQGGLGAPPQIDTTKLGVLSRAIDVLPESQQIAPIQQLVGQLGQAPPSLQTSELIKQLNDKLEQLTRATDENTSATSAMTDVLSPFYSSDPRRTHLGFRAFAGGGIMTQYGELPLRQYQGGGMATSPQVAVFGEGSTPEAYVPVPSGRIPVEIRTPANSNQRPVNVTINVMGNADAGTVAALKQTSFQKAQQLRRITG